MTTAPIPPDAPVAAGLRARKKAQTRQAISDEATRLFLERGFDAVTLAEVAEAAGVSVKTIFNYFGSKEELFLDREELLHSAILAAVRERGPGVRVTQALLRLFTEARMPDGTGWDPLFDRDRYGVFRRFLEVWHASPALQGRYLSSNERLQEILAPELAAELGRRDDDDDVRMFAAMLVAAFHRRMTVLSGMVLAGASAEATRDRVVAATGVAFARVALAFPDLDRPGPGRSSRR